MDIKSAILSGETYLGIEFGTTRIKAMLIGPDHAPIASGDHVWESRLQNGMWTYSIETVWAGLRSAYANLVRNITTEYGVPLTRVAALGISGMMHGYLALGSDGRLLAPFRTWRNTITGAAAAELTERFQFNIPQRWSIAHLYQAMLNDEAHVSDISYLTTLAGYVHYRMTGEKVLGVGEASGMFPIDTATCDYDETMLQSFDALAAEKGYSLKLREILPKVLPAGAHAGVLTEAGAKLLDPTGILEPGIPLAPPEGDAGTGMVATNSIAERTGNVSAGTSVFAMIVLEKPLSQVYPEIDIVTTPDGRPVAMVHSNNCTSEINAWAEVFREFLKAMGQEVDTRTIFTAMFNAAAEGAPDVGDLMLFNYLSGEHITDFSEGRLLLARTPEAQLTFPNFMRAQLYSALATLKIGMGILDREKVTIDRLLGHGGFFKTPKVGQQILADATGAPVSVMETTADGGPWGMALLAAYCVRKGEGERLVDYLNDRVFADQKVLTLEPNRRGKAGFATFIDRYAAALPVERAAVEYIK